MFLKLKRKKKKKSSEIIFGIKINKPQIDLGKDGKILFLHVDKSSRTKIRILLIIADRLVISTVSGIWRIKR